MTGRYVNMTPASATTIAGLNPEASCFVRRGPSANQL
jgi:hypothetical protein